MINCLETISIKNKKIQNLEYHQERVDEVFKNLYKKENAWDLSTILKQDFQEGWLKCRFIYNEENYHIEILPYQRKTIKKIILVDCHDYQYTYKFEDRNYLYQLLKDHPSADEVILVKDGKITDCTIGNIALKKNGEWFTPKTPLLNGTKRRKLIREKKLIELPILANEIQNFDKIAIINAFLDLEEDNLLSVSDAFS